MCPAPRPSSCKSRALAAIRDIYFKHAGQLIALVSHGALIKTVMAHIEGRHMAQLWTPPQMHNCAHSIVCVDAEDNYRIRSTPISLMISEDIQSNVLLTRIVQPKLRTVKTDATARAAPLGASDV